MRTLLLFLGAFTAVLLLSGAAAVLVGRFINLGRGDDDQDGGAR